MSRTSCFLDPIPGSLMKVCYRVLLPVITDIINLSFESAILPKSFKEAVLNPILKKDSLDHEVYKNFRPISNLKFVSKAMEKVVAARLDQHLENNDLHGIFQSAYKAGHSTETALTLIHNDILRFIDNNECVMLVLLVLLDLPAAFDTVDHTILLTGLNNRFAIRGKALTWLRSYLSDRTQFLKVENECSSCRKLIYGVP